MSEGTTRILMIDDEQLVLEVFTAFLEDSGFEVLQANDGQTGIELIRQEQPDLVLCDLRMPGMDGLNVLATVTREYPELPILVVSGLGGMGDAIQALASSYFLRNASRLTTEPSPPAGGGAWTSGAVSREVGIASSPEAMRASSI